MLRGGLVESVHRVHVAVADARGRLASRHGDPGFETFLRSSAKPFQAMTVVLSGAAEKFGLTAVELATIAGSHNGEAEHVAVVEGLLAKLGLRPEALRCGVHAPYHKPTADATRGRWTVLQHNCSGKHAGMLAAALALGADTSTYLDAAHPVQRLNARVLAACAGVDEQSIGVAVDGCGVPTFRLPLSASATAFARLVRPDGLPAAEKDAAERVAAAMFAHPFYVAGRDRFDTVFMDAAEGRVLAKAGAEAFQALADAETGVGLALKVEDGTSRAVAPATIEAARQLGWLEGRALETLGDWWRAPVTNVAGREVGRVEPRFELARRPQRATGCARHILDVRSTGVPRICR